MKLKDSEPNGDYVVLDTENNRKIEETHSIVDLVGQIFKVLKNDKKNKIYVVFQLTSYNLFLDIKEFGELEIEEIEGAVPTFIKGKDKMWDYLYKDLNKWFKRAIEKGVIPSYSIEFPTFRKPGGGPPYCLEAIIEHTGEVIITINFKLPN